MNTLYWCGVTNQNNFIDCVTNPVVTLTIIFACYSCDNHGGFFPSIKYAATDLFQQFEEIIVVSKTGRPHEILNISSENPHPNTPMLRVSASEVGLNN